MKADNTDHFEIVLRNFDYDDLMDWVDENYIECHRVSGLGSSSKETWLVTGCDDATLMKLRWG
jgi:hypothetical protein